MPSCSECGSEYPSGAGECPLCGAQEVRCSRCGETHSDPDACSACGALRVQHRCASHPDTFAEGRCVVCGRLVCRVCQQGPGRVFLCHDHARIGLIQGWAQIYSTTSEFEAQLLRENLLAEGMDAQIFSQKDQMLSVDLGDLSIVRLLVPARQYERARAVIRSHMDAVGEVAFACPGCGEAYEPGSGVCGSCGSTLTPGTED
jgi:hypothetical protein